MKHEEDNHAEDYDSDKDKAFAAIDDVDEISMGHISAEESKV
jgi:hypothetical protein